MASDPHAPLLNALLDRIRDVAFYGWPIFIKILLPTFESLNDDEKEVALGEYRALWQSYAVWRASGGLAEGWEERSNRDKQK
eukprot:1082734-Amorphochlora_amoeboformis.AAC.1